MKLTRAYNIARTILVLLCVTLVVFTALFGLNIEIGWLGVDIDQKGFVEEDALSLGLDLAGGTSVVFEVVPKEGNEVTEDGLQNTIKVLEARVSNPEASIYKISDTEIQLDIPGYDNPQEVIERFGDKGTLNFKDADGNVRLDYTAVENAEALVNTETGEPYVGLNFTEEGARLFETVTREIASKGSGKNYLSICIGETVVSSPTVKEAISGGKASITSPSFIDNQQEVTDLTSYINAGVTEYDLKCDSEHGSWSVVSATLGEEALDTSILAAAIGLILVMVFMIVLYRVPGIVASISLCAYTAVVILCILGFEVTLTLPGIAGVILSIGMAVDANVIIFERMKEEIRNGKSVKAACDAGFKKALSAIIDSNVTTAIAALVLIFVGSGMVRSFGMTLIIGVVVSVLTAFFLSKGLLRLFTGMGITKPSLYCPKAEGGNK